MTSNKFEAMSAYRKRKVRELLRSEFTEYFTRMTTETAQWPNISHEEFVDALADSLFAMGKDSQMGVALAQTLVYELQDRINQKLK